MPLVTEDISGGLETLIQLLNKDKQTDPNVAIQQFCDKVEEIIYNAIKKITITIEPGSIIVVGSQTTQSNVTPIILNEVVT